MTRIFRHIITIAIVAFAVTAGVAAIAPQQLRDRAYGFVRTTPAAVEAAAVSSSGRPCSVATIAGDWAFRATGKTPDGLDLTAVGTFHLTKDGTSSAHLWANIGGTTFLDFPRTGTTTVDADCTGTQAWDDGGPIAKTVILRSGREIWATYDQPGFSTVILKRIDDPL